ncbi:MAG: hypothetical protein ACREQY_16965 [Candidatus Binatia bacterium]
MTRREARERARELLGDSATLVAQNDALGNPLCIVGRYVAVYHCRRCTDGRGYWINEGMGDCWEDALEEVERRTLELAVDYCENQPEGKVQLKRERLRRRLRCAKFLSLRIIDGGRSAKRFAATVDGVAVMGAR